MTLECLEMEAWTALLAGSLPASFNHLSSSLHAASTCVQNRRGGIYGPRQFWDHMLSASDLRAKTALLHWVYPEDILGEGVTGLTSYGHVWTNHGDQQAHPGLWAHPIS